MLDLAAMPPVHPLPPGIEVRPVLAEHLPLIASSIGEAYQNQYADSRFQETWLLEESVARLSAPRQDPTLWQIAWAGDRMVGEVLPLIEGGRALMYEIVVAQSCPRGTCG